MDVSILKPQTASSKAAIISRPVAHSNTQSATVSSTSTPAPKTPDEGRSGLPSYTEPLSDDEDDGDDTPEDGQPRALGKDESLIAGMPADMAKEVEEAKALREKEGREHNVNDPRIGDHLASTQAQQQQFAKLTPQNLERLLKAKYANEHQKAAANGSDDVAAEDPDTGAPADPSASNVTLKRTEYVNSFRAPKGKLVSVPIRIEPKVYFANGQSIRLDKIDKIANMRFESERTFLVSLPMRYLNGADDTSQSWVEFAVLLSAIGIGLMNFTPQRDAAGLAAGISFTIVALLAIAYAGVRFVWRAINIR